ncbi:low temperature requirement protein A [Nonomuraea africana]|uniref:Low temperature requirement protein LtrA n=1 Tax=Nonomuraea africana TaxID=46171 RepID=A0ABR9KMC7_9ACTN|nr:low temperature requirement protein A [Nonomuraea africana]MBE1562707.1 low temperature requirement protein LtrA [Nonomuraea africana]
MTQLRTMRARATDEPHRVATPLELFFDLFFVVAVSFAGTQLAHALSAGHLGEALTGYLTAFFAIWWAWMNFTWFASAYDTDDWVYRTITLVQMSGVLVLASGIPRAFEHHDYRIFWLGYLIMRLAMASQWLRAAASDPEGRRVALRYAIGICAAQVYWLVLFVTSGTTVIVAYAVGAAIELAVPVWAEWGTRTHWHPHHIAERYGLFTIIMMGENVLAATLSLRDAVAAEGPTPTLVALSIGALVIAFALWWIYFAPDTPAILRSNRHAIPWGYGHYLIFAAVGGLSAGFEVVLAFVTGDSVLTRSQAGLAIAIPVALFLLVVWALHIRPHRYGPADTAAFLIAAVLVLLSALAPSAIPLIAVIVAALVVATTLIRREASPAR